MKLFFYTIFLLFPLSLSSQNEWNTWYFGAGAGLDFNTNPPTVLDGGQIKTREGCATISDQASGQLLFYTDGTTVWDKNHQITPNGSGLNGDYSASQSAIIVPKPGASGKYYIFTSDDISGNKGYQYSEFDITLNNGNGDIIPNKKNIPLHNPGTEKIMVIKVCNFYWLITQTPYLCLKTTT